MTDNDQEKEDCQLIKISPDKERLEKSLAMMYDEQQSIIFINQNDNDIAHLTVKETNQTTVHCRHFLLLDIV